MQTGAAAQLRERERADELCERILDASLVCMSRWGLRKTTLDDVARAAGCSRATVYRQFPGGKPALIEAVAAREVVRLLLECLEHADVADSLGDFMVEAMVTAARYFIHHEALEYLLRHEPEALAPFLSFDRLEPTLAVTRGVVAPSIERLCDRETAEEAVEWAVRMVLSYTFNPSAAVQLTDERHARQLVSTYFLPGVATDCVDIQRPMFNQHISSAEPSL